MKTKLKKKSSTGTSKSRAYAVKKRKQKRMLLAKRTSSILVLLGFLLCLGYIGWRGLSGMGDLFFGKNKHFELKTIQTRTDGKLSRDLILEYSGIDLPCNLFAVDPALIREKLRNIALVKSVSVRRNLPNHLEITLSERVPVAWIAGNETLQYPKTIDNQGFVLPTHERARNLPAIRGVAPLMNGERVRPGERLSGRDLKCALKILDICTRKSWGRLIEINHLDLSNPDYIELFLTDRTRVKLPETSSAVLDQKLARLVKIIKATEIRNAQLAEVNLLPDGANTIVKYR